MFLSETQQFDMFQRENILNSSVTCEHTFYQNSAKNTTIYTTAGSNDVCVVNKDILIKYPQGFLSKRDQSQ